MICRNGKNSIGFLIWWNFIFTDKKSFADQWIKISPFKLYGDFEIICVGRKCLGIVEMGKFPWDF